MSVPTRKLSVYYLIALLLLLPLVCNAQVSDTLASKTVIIPDTPAGKQFAAWLQAFNTGKREPLRQFIVTHFEKRADGSLPVEEILDIDIALYQTTHGFEVKKILSSTSATIAALVQAKWTGFWMKIQIFVTAEAPAYTVAIPPYAIVGMGRQNLEAPPELLPQRQLTHREIAARTDALLSKLATADAFSGTVVVAKDGKAFYKRAIGLASRAYNVPNRVDTRFNLASITKMFTAVAVAQLVEQGKLSYSDTVGKILPDYPNGEVARTVTLHHLLSHTSGLIGARALVEKSPQPPTARTLAEMVKPFVNEPLSFPPGQQFDYSNAGFILLGAIVEKASGQSYYDYVREQIFKPAGMKDTDFYHLDTDPPNIATGFADGPNHTRLNNIFDLGIIGSPAGGAYSTGEDMARFHRALVQHTLLNETSLKTLWTGVTEQPGRGAEYGYGSQITHYNGERIIWHGGGWKGITNHFDMYPERGYTVVILSNIDSDPASIAYKLREWLTQGVNKEQPVNAEPPLLTLSATASKMFVSKGEPLTITVTIANRGGTAHASIIDMEVKDAKGMKVNQQYTLGQKIEAGQTRSYLYTWTPSVAGTYTIDLGAFGPGWTSKYLFSSGVLTLSVTE
jgi:CubicO group peptidase (beta-lactamase class C family)